MTITITLSAAGVDTGPFSLFSDVDGYTTAFVTGVSRTALLAGYTTTLAPVGTTIVRVKSTGLCSNYIDITLTFPTTTTTTSTCPTYYQLGGCDPADNAFTLIAPTLGIGQQYVLPGSPVKYYTYTGASITSCIAPGTYNASIQQTLNIGCPS
jgi:hypothetical protein